MIRTDQAHLYVAALTHEGMTGKNNEDNFGVTAFRLNAGNPTPVVFAVVADGIGGHRSGEVAAEMTIEIIANEVAQSTSSNPLPTFQKAFYKASEAIYARAQAEGGDNKGMGATCACLMVVGDRLYIAWAGDSRIYLARGEQLLRLTTDHSWIQEALDKGILDPEMADKHPNQHVIRRYLGAPTPTEPDLRLRLKPGETNAQMRANQGVTLNPGDRLLMCTDGLTDLVKDNEINAYLQTRDLHAAANNLINLANSRGGHDNITVVLMRVPEGLTTGPLRWMGWVKTG